LFLPNQELNGRCVLPLVTEEKATYQSIQKVKTFTPPSQDRAFVFAQLSKNIENACIKARRYKLAAKGAVLLLKTQQFRIHSIAVRFSRATAFPHEILRRCQLVVYPRGMARLRHGYTICRAAV
jgi:hypothetical protein